MEENNRRDGLQSARNRKPRKEPSAKVRSATRDEPLSAQQVAVDIQARGGRAADNLSVECCGPTCRAPLFDGEHPTSKLVVCQLENLWAEQK